MPTNQYFQLPDQKKQEMLEIAHAIFSKNTFEKVSIRQISDAFGMSVGGFYRFFTSKDDLYLYLIDWKLSERYNRVILLSRSGEEYDSGQNKDFWDAFHHSSADIRKQYYFRVKNHLLFSIQQSQVNHLPNLDAKKKMAVSFLLTVLPFVMRELSDLTGEPSYDGDYWVEIRNLILNGVYHLPSDEAQ